jgi:hypothetical protein
MLRWGLRVGSVLVVGLAGWLMLGGTGSAGDKATPAPEVVALIKHEAKAIEDLVAKGEPDKKAARKVKIAAFMIAVYAQANATKENGAQMATYRDAALKALKLAADGKFKEAGDIAKALPTMKADPNAKPGPVDLQKVFDFGEMMHQFSSERVGGFGIEKEIGDLSEEKNLTPAQLERAGSLGYRMAAVAHASKSFTEDREDNSKPGRTLKNWMLFSDNFRQASLELAAVARSKNEAGTFKALEKVTGTCVKCHDVFR